MAQNWYKNSNYICLLAAKDIEQLSLIKTILENNNLKVSVFYEPDLDNAMTAIAVEPSDMSRKLLANLPLALRNNSYTSTVSDKETKKEKWVCSSID